MREFLPEMARKHGFDAFGVAPAAPDVLRGERLDAWISVGAHGDMDWMARDPQRRAAPQELWPEVRSIIMLGTNYGPESDPLAMLAHPDKASIALYALRRDYHDIIKARLKAFARDLVARSNAGVKVFVDTAPVMEKPLAAAAGLGWQGKHSVLVSRAHGNWLLLGAIYTTLALVPDKPEADHCGSCTRCLDICPTNAFPSPYVLDSRACIAYLTIEHKGPITRGLRPKFGNRVFGCDDCLAICPWNKFAKTASDTKLALKSELAHLDLAMLAGLDDPAFRTLFAQTPVKRTGIERFLRNVLIAIGNSGDLSLIPAAHARLSDPVPLVRGMAVWALSRLLETHEFAILAATYAPEEVDPHVCEEWQEGLKQEGSGQEASCGS